MSHKVTVLRESLGKTVRLLVKEGVEVTQRGTQPMVLARNGKVFRVNLPMIPDNASIGLLEAIQGYLDHECAHVLYTDFKRDEKIRDEEKLGRGFFSMLNIIEDIRIEKLLPRQFPGTAANLSKMRSGEFGKALDEICKKAVADGNPIATIVPAFRALAGQREMKELMDDGGYWAVFAPILIKIPDIGERLQALETYDDAITLTRYVMDTLGNPVVPKQPCEDEKDEGEEDDSEKSEGDGPGEDEGDEGEADGDPCDGDGDGEDGDGEPSEDAEGEGDGDGDDGEEGDESGNGGGDADGDESSEDGGDENGAGGKTGDRAVTMEEAVKSLNPLQRRAMFMYNKNNKSVEEIASKLNMTEEGVKEALRSARNRLNSVMRGA